MSAVCPLSRARSTIPDNLGALYNPVPHTMSSRGILFILLNSLLLYKCKGSAVMTAECLLTSLQFINTPERHVLLLAEHFFFLFTESLILAHLLENSTSR